jgi:F-type H+-transporting ATPase subunit alpha
MRASAPDILDAIRTEKVLSQDTETKLVAFLDRFAKTFA